MSISFFLCLLSLTYSDIIELNEKSFYSQISNNNSILVHFYVPWGKHCQDFEKILERLSPLAEEIELTLAKVDCEKEPNISNKYYISAYPAIKLFRGNEVFNFDGNRKFEDIWEFLKKKTGNGLTFVSSEDELQHFKNETFIIGYFPNLNSANFTIYKNISIYKNIKFYYTNNYLLIEKINSINSIYLFRNSDKRTTHYRGDQITISQLSDFVDDNILPSVVYLTSANWGSILKMKKKIVFFFIKGTLFDKSLKMLNDVIDDFFERIQIVIVDVKNSNFNTIIEFFDFMDAPTFRGFEYSKMTKFKPENDTIERNNVLEFITKLDNGHLKKYVKIQPLPSGWNQSSVKILTLENFEEIVFDENLSVFVLFFAPWCGHCRRLSPVWNELGDYFDSNPNILIVKTDATENEFEFDIRSFPTLIYFPRGSVKGYNSYEIYNGPRDFDSLKNFVYSFEEGYNLSSEEL